jgi:peroxygenase
VLGHDSIHGWADVRRLLAANRDVADPLGWAASAISWSLLLLVARDQAGVVSREAVRSMYDGTLWCVAAVPACCLAWAFAKG